MKLPGFKTVSAYSAVSTLALMLTLADVQASEPEKAFNIAAQPLAKALLEYSRQSDTTVVVPDALVAGKHAKAVSGNMSPADALGQMLEGSGLKIMNTEDGGYTLIEVEEADEPTDEKPEVDEEIVVSGQRIVTRNRINTVEPTLVYDAGYFERFEPLTLNDMLKRVPGIFFNELFNSPDNVNGTSFVQAETRLPRFRNLDSSFSQILINGRRVANIDFGNGNGENFLATLPAENIKEIRVIRSPNAGIDSSGAGLTLNIILKDGSSYSGSNYRIGASSLDGEFSGVASINMGGATDAFDYSLSVTSQNRSGASTRNSASTNVETVFFPPFVDIQTTTDFESTTVSQDLKKDRSLIGNIQFPVGAFGDLNIEGKYLETDTSGTTDIADSSTSVTTGTEFGMPVDPTPVTNSRLTNIENIRDTKNYGLAATYHLELDSLSWESVISYDASDLDGNSFSDSNSALINNRLSQLTGKTKHFAFNNHFSYQASESHKFRFGVDLLRNKNDNNRTTSTFTSEGDAVGFQNDSNDNQTIDRTDLFFIYEWEIGDTLNLQVGGRYERSAIDSSATPSLDLGDLTGQFQFDPNVLSESQRSELSTDVSGFNPNVHLRWTFAENHDLRISVAQTVRRPNLSELDPVVSIIAPRFQRTLQVNSGNPNLENEESIGIDIGYDWRIEDGIIGLNIFQRIIENRIREVAYNIDDFDPGRPQLGAELVRLRNFAATLAPPYTFIALQPQNSDNELKVRGVELDLSLPLNFISETAQLYMNATYSSQQEPGIQPIRSSAVNLTYDHVLEAIGLTYGTSINWIAKDERDSGPDGLARFISDRSLDPNVEVFVEKKLDNDMTMRLSIENLLSAEEETISETILAFTGVSSNSNGTSFLQTDPRILFTLRGGF